MFRLQRYFSIASGVAILLVTLALSWSYHVEEYEDQIDGAQARNVSLAQTFANTIWPEYSAHLSQPFTSGEALQADATTQRLHQRLLSMSRGAPVIKIKIYNLDGVAMYSSVPPEIGENKRANPAFQKALRGTAVSELTHRGTMSISEGEVENVDVVSTYIPIRASDQSVQAVFELYTDVTEALVAVTKQTQHLVAGLVVVFAALYACLLLIVRRADGIIARQYREIAANEEQIRAKNDELAQANRAKTEFLSSMSHELRTPMNAILGFAQLLESEPGSSLNANQQRFVAEILKAGRHLLELINEVLDLARIEAGKLTLSVEPVSVAAILAECMPLIQNMARENEIDVAPPARDGDPRVLADYMRLKQAMLNLLSNAVKYNRRGGHITVAVTPIAESRYRISVADTGIGIPEGQREEIFRPFHRIAADAAQVEGTGIGLAITQNLVKAMKGDIGFDSERGKGTTFWIDLPAAPPLEEAEKRPRPLASPHAAPAGSTKTLLYVEDNPANVMLMQEIARRIGMRFISAHNGEIGIALAASEHPDLIVMDINLPQMSGYEALARLRANPATASIPVMALSANAMEKDVTRGLEAGFVRYETKPFRIDAMARAMAEVLEVHA